MADRSAHPGDPELVELALDNLPQDDESAALHHLARCASCRVRYDELSATVDAVLAASPAVAPPAGFEARILGGLPDDGPVPLARPRRRRLPVLVAAAATVVALLLGGVAGVVLHRALTTPEPASGGDWTALQTSAGDDVGSVVPTRYDDREVVVVRILDGPPGKHYRCQMVAADGSRHDAGEWTVPASGEAVWIAPVPDVGAERVELVTDDGRVWSAAPIG